MTYKIPYFNGRMLRFEVDDYIRLKPDRKKAWTFYGVCPETKKAHGIIVNEYLENISLPFLGKQFVGRDGLIDFFDFMKFKKRRKRPSIATVKQIQQLDKKLMKLSKDVISQSKEVLEQNKRLIRKKDYEFNFEYVIEFYMNQNHPLYHPETDNILCVHTDIIHPNIYEPSKLLKRDNWGYIEDQSYKLEYYYILYDLVNRKGVRIDDLIQTEFIWVNYKLEILRKYPSLKFNVS